MIAEFTGLSAVGKSTLTPLVLRELRARGAMARRATATRATTKVAIAWSAGLAWLRVWVALGPRRARRVRGSGFGFRLWRYLRRMELFGRLEGVHIVDGGLTRLLMTLHMTGAQRDLHAAWACFGPWLATPDLVVVIEGSDDEISLRRQARGTGNDLLAPRPTEAEKDALEQLKTALKAVAGSAPGLELIVVDNVHGDELRVATQIADAIERRL